MAKFKFRLQVELEHRRRIEDERQRELARELRQRMIIEDQLRQMQMTISDSKKQLGDALVGRVDMSAVGRFARFAGQSAQRAHALVISLAQGEKRIDQSRQRLLEATRDRKAMELLRERQFNRWLLKQQRREMVMSDDVAVQTHSRRIAMEAAQ